MKSQIILIACIVVFILSIVIAIVTYNGNITGLTVLPPLTLFVLIEELFEVAR